MKSDTLHIKNPSQELIDWIEKTNEERKIRSEKMVKMYLRKDKINKLLNKHNTDKI